MSPLRLVGVAMAFALGGCATAAAPGRYDLKTVRNHEMSPYVIHEECLKVAAGERIEYYFTSTFPINFNIHYHEANVVLMPIVRDRTLEDSAVFAPTIPQDYCLMWEAGATGATIDYGVRLRAAVAQ